MKILFIALGSQGDVLPYLALGKALAARDHRVMFATFENFADQVQESGLGYHPIRGDGQAILRSPAGQGIAEAGQNVLQMAASIMKSFGSLAQGYAEDLTALSHLELDLIINQLPGGLYGYSLAESLGVPQVLASVMPLTPTSEQAMLAFPQGLSWLPGYNRLSHWLAYQIVWSGFRSVINRWRRCDLSLRQAPFWGYFRKTWQSTPVLNGFSRHVVPRPGDWGDHIWQTGYWFPDPDNWSPDGRLQNFLDAGRPPVFLGFGSMPISDPAGTIAILLEALRLSGQRAILQSGWGTLKGVNLPPEVLMIEYVPYGWLFPRMVALVHHGGSGTTAFGFRAGVPMTILPFTFDQFYWGARIRALGVGPPPIPFRRLRPDRLAEAIVLSIEDQEMRERAMAMGAEIASEDGISAAVRWLEGIRPGVSSSAS